jgi:hypothetical protein
VKPLEVADVELQELRRFLVREALDIAENDCGPVVRR